MHTHTLTLDHKWNPSGQGLAGAHGLCESRGVVPRFVGQHLLTLGVGYPVVAYGSFLPLSLGQIKFQSYWDHGLPFELDSRSSPSWTSLFLLWPWHQPPERWWSPTAWPLILMDSLGFQVHSAVLIIPLPVAWLPFWMPQTLCVNLTSHICSWMLPVWS